MLMIIMMETTTTRRQKILEIFASPLLGYVVLYMQPKTLWHMQLRYVKPPTSKIYLYLCNTGSTTIIFILIQLSVASMVQRFERDGSTERARSRASSAGIGFEAAGSGLRKWPPPAPPPASPDPEKEAPEKPTPTSVVSNRRSESGPVGGGGRQGQGRKLVAATSSAAETA